jgi:hypothetical protein
MPRIVPLSLVLVAAAACASATPVNGPDGQPGWFSISCKKDQTNCYEKAGEVCPSGYVTADSQSHSGTAVNAGMTQGAAWMSAHPTYQGDMLIKCQAGGASPGTSAAAPVQQPPPVQPATPAY